MSSGTHSPRRAYFRAAIQRPAQLSGHNIIVPQTKPERNRTSSSGYVAMQKGLVSEDTSPIAFVARKTARIPAKIPALRSQLAEGFEPPTL